MTNDQRMQTLGAYINGALYLAGVIAVGLMTGNVFAWKAAIAAAGLSFVTYVLVVWGTRPAAFVLSGLSNGLGLLAGLALLFG
jgi:small-conductance mechanosensitive channel